MGYPEEAPFSYELPPHTNLLIAQAEKCSVSGHPVAVASVFNNIRNDDMIFVLAESIIKISLE